MIDELRERLDSGEPLMPTEVRALLSSAEAEHAGEVADLRVEVARLRARQPISDRGAWVTSIVVVVASVTCMVIFADCSSDPTDNARDQVQWMREYLRTDDPFREDIRKADRICSGADNLVKTASDLDALCAEADL